MAAGRRKGTAALAAAWGVLAQGWPRAFAAADHSQSLALLLSLPSVRDCLLSRMSAWDEEVFGLDEEVGGEFGESRRVLEKLHKDGYREGKSVEEERELQRGFDEGFTRAMELSRILGRLYGGICCLSPDPTVLDRVEDILLRQIPEGGKVLQEHINELERTFSAAREERPPAKTDDHPSIDEHWTHFKVDIVRFIHPPDSTNVNKQQTTL